MSQAFAMSTTMLPAVTTTRFDAFEMRQHYQRQERPGNGIVYVGEEMGRTRQMYKSTGLPTREVINTGRLIDIYV